MVQWSKETIGAIIRANKHVHKVVNKLDLLPAAPTKNTKPVSGSSMDMPSFKFDAEAFPQVTTTLFTTHSYLAPQQRNCAS